MIKPFKTNAQSLGDLLRSKLGALHFSVGAAALEIARLTPNSVAARDGVRHKDRPYMQERYFFTRKDIRDLLEGLDSNPARDRALLRTFFVEDYVLFARIPETPGADAAFIKLMEILGWPVLDVAPSEIHAFLNKTIVTSYQGLASLIDRSGYRAKGDLARAAYEYYEYTGR